MTGDAVAHEVVGGGEGVDGRLLEEVRVRVLWRSLQLASVALPVESGARAPLGTV